MSGKINALMFSMAKQASDTFGGLQKAINAGPLAGLRRYDAACAPVHCMRSVAQRRLALNTQITSNISAPIPANFNVLLRLLDGVGGVLEGVTGDGLEIVNNDQNIDRQRVENLVLIGMRTKAQVWITGDSTFPGAAPEAPFQVHNGATSALERAFLNYINLRIADTADEADPWLLDTRLGYFYAPEGEDFHPIPPVKAASRDFRMFINRADADFSNNGAGAVTRPPVGVIPVFLFPYQVIANVNLSLETLWTLDPADCKGYWPGYACNPKQGKGVKGKAIHGPGTMAPACGCKACASK